MVWGERGEGGREKERSFVFASKRKEFREFFALTSCILEPLGWIRSLTLLLPQAYYNTLVIIFRGLPRV